MYGCESWALKNWCFWTVVLEETLESPLVCEEIQPVHPKGDQSWVFIGRTDAEAETPILWPPDVKSWLIWKDPDAGKDWGQEKGTTEDEMAGWHYWLDRHGFRWTLGVGDGQGSLACCGSCSRRARYDWATELNWTEPGDTGWIPDWEDPTCHGAAKPVCHNWACALEPRSCNYWAPVPQLLKPEHLRAHAPQEKPRQWEACTPQLESGPHPPQLEKKPMKQYRPRQPI